MLVKVTVAGLSVLAAPLLALFALAALAAGAVNASASSGQARFDPSDDALADIPPLMLSLYVARASACPGLPWQVLAGIAKVESDHGRYGGASIDVEGNVRPPIIGIPLNGTNATARIVDTDNGRYDRDTIWDRAVGPFQFIPTSWAIFGQDGNRDGIRDPNNVYDAVPAAVAHLCPYGQVDDIEAAIFAYNRSRSYVALVLEWAARYTGPISSIGSVVAGYAYPTPLEYATVASAARVHNGYPAIDLPLPVGTSVFAMVDGTISRAIGNAGLYEPGGPGRCGNTVIVSGVDGVRYTYCHLSTVAVAVGDSITAGQAIALSGGQPGTPGAGNTTGPHLHLGLQAYGQSVCPQPVLLAILRGTPIPATAAPPSGCVSPGASTDWAAWLDAVLQQDGAPT